MDRRIDKCLALCRDWAEGRVASGNEPPWAWYQYMKLIETVEAIQMSRRAASGGGLTTGRATAGPKTEGVADIGARRRRRRREDEEPPLPM